MTEKDRLELLFWTRIDPAMHLAKYELYMAEWGYEDADSVFEIGVGPYSGFLPYIKASRKVGLDPLIEAYRDAGIFRECTDVEYVCKYFENFDTVEKFDAVLCADTLDHGDLDFHVVPRIASFLKPGGKFYLHVHLRPKNKLNLIHDHSLKAEKLNEALQKTALVEDKRVILPNDIDGKFCEALVGVWHLP